MFDDILQLQTTRTRVSSYFEEPLDTTFSDALLPRCFRPQAARVTRPLTPPVIPRACPVSRAFAEH